MAFVRITADLFNLLRIAIKLVITSGISCSLRVVANEMTEQYIAPSSEDVVANIVLWYCRIVVAGGRKEKILRTMSENDSPIVASRTYNAAVTPTVTRTKRRCAMVQSL